jgi:hypothetical protein
MTQVLFRRKEETENGVSVSRTLDSMKQMSKSKEPKETNKREKQKEKRKTVSNRNPVTIELEVHI